MHYFDSYYSPFLQRIEIQHSTGSNMFIRGTEREIRQEFYLIIAKYIAYGIERKTLRLVSSYLKGQKQSVKINNNYSNYIEIITGVPQISIFRPILFSQQIQWFVFLHRDSLYA